MKISRVHAIVLRQLYLLRGSPTRVIPLFVWGAIDVMLWGFITKYLNHFETPGVNFIPILLGAVLMWDFLVRVMHGTCIAFMEDTWSKNFLNLFISPLSIGDYLGGLVVSSILTSMVGLVVMLIMATGFFGLSFFDYGIYFIPYLFALFLFGIALGILGCALMLRLGPAAEWFIWPIPAVISPFAGVFYPVSTLPEWMQFIAHLLPPSYIFESMRAIISGKAADVNSLFIAYGMTAAYILLACICFNLVYKYAVNSGLIARYSAESIN